MNKNNIDYLRQHAHHWHTLRDAGYIKNISGETATELLRIAREEFDALYLTCLRHPQNVCELIRYVYSLATEVLESDSAETQEVATVANACGDETHTGKEPDLREPETGKTKPGRGRTKPAGIKQKRPGGDIIRSADKECAFPAARPPP